MVNQEKQSLRIAFLAPCHPKDKRVLSTCMYYMGQALEKHCGDVYYCDPINSFQKRYIGRLIYGVSRRLFKKNVLRDRLLFVARKHGKIAAQRLDGRSFDAIIAVGNPQDVGFLATDIPIALVLDATFVLQHDYNPHFSNLWKWAARQANKAEQIAQSKATPVKPKADQKSVPKATVTTSKRPPVQPDPSIVRPSWTFLQPLVA